MISNNGTTECDLCDQLLCGQAHGNLAGPVPAYTAIDFCSPCTASAARLIRLWGSLHPDQIAQVTAPLIAFIDHSAGSLSSADLGTGRSARMTAKLEHFAHPTP